jgi:hypothetical protein
MNQLKYKAYTFLRWSERHTKTDMIYLTKGGFWLTLAQVISSASGKQISYKIEYLVTLEE